MIGNAPCSGCGSHIYNIPIDEGSKESDGSGGFWFDVLEGGAVCTKCNEPLTYFHVPPVDDLVIPECMKNSKIKVE